MFPETFVEKHLAATKFHGVVFDPFCGRGTTIFESIIRERDAAGCDIHPVAVCVSGAKSDPPTRKEVLRRLSELEEESSSSSAVDCDGYLSEFFSLCFIRQHTAKFGFCEKPYLGAKTALIDLSPLCASVPYMGSLIGALIISAIECHVLSVRSRHTLFGGGERTAIGRLTEMPSRSLGT